VSAVLRAEWTKLRSVRSTWWLLLLGVAMTIGFSVLICAGTTTDSGAATDDDVVAISLTGLYLGQIAFIVLGVLAVSSEYRTGTIRTTFTAVPKRGMVMTAKAIVVGSVVLVSGLLASLVSFVIGQALLGGNGYIDVSLADSTALRAVIGGGIYLAVLALLGLGIGALLRNPSGAIAAAIGILLGPVLLAAFLPSGAQITVLELAPTTAGLAIVNSVADSTTLWPGQLAPAAGFALFCAYAAVTFAAASVLVRRLDV
jgi:hypothetical protein